MTPADWLIVAFPAFAFVLAMGWAFWPQGAPPSARAEMDRTRSLARRCDAS